MGEGAARPGSAALAAGRPERGWIRLDLHRFETPRWTSRGAGVLARSRRRPGQASARALRIGAPGRTVRGDRAADPGAGAVVLRRERHIHRPAGAEALVRELSFGWWSGRTGRGAALSQSPRPW